ncbi:GT-D fold domain-containing glycosyltransferase [Chryseobacterium soli]|uniref:GT-D fold domain-containing glycosyltransferase n=1 Tax=Chryseobacterium soli TaxID=445961 RepID=UPI0029539241|nr:GT-D fold domain-containing glycosyltransferase [Chryseobacterium soli]
MNSLTKRYHYYRFFFNTRKLRKNFPFYKVETLAETLDEIIIHRKNISRFGDGEFRLVLNTAGIGFQNGSEELTERLREVLSSNVSNHLIAIPETFSLKNNLNWRVKFWWLNYINTVGVQISQHLKPEKKYSNAFITRFYLDYETKKHIPNILKKFKKIWDDQDVLIVEGAYSRLGVGNDLFDGVKSLQRILCPTKDAFSAYHKILSEIKIHGKNKLVLLALGPTATVMAFDLAKENIWTIDIGHVDLEYMWYLQNAQEKIPVEGRLVNEATEQLNLDIPTNERLKYEKSIIKTM